MANKKANFGISTFLVLCLAYQAYGQSVNCTTTGAGRFADPTDTTCQNYTYCVYVASTGSFVSYDYTCPSTSVFNPNSGLCTASTNYVCNVTATTCTADGYIADPSVTDCSSYIECVDIDGVFSETTYSCPTGTYYNPNTTFCDSTYTCTTNTTTTIFTCSSTGRFANSADTTCQTYYLCVLASNGTFLQYEYTCPTTSVFSPVSRLCTTSYTCT